MYYVKEKTNFCRNYLQAFSTEEISKYHINDYFRINFKQIIQKSKEEKKYGKKKNHHANFMQILKVFWFHKTIKRNIQMNLITK